MFSKNKIMLGAAVVGALVGGGMSAMPAMASYQQCDSNGRLCAWSDISYQGQFHTKYVSQGLENISWANNDEFSSTRNNTVRNAAMYEHANGRGKCLTVRAKTADPWLGNTWSDGTTWNDKVSSWRVNGSC